MNEDSKVLQKLSFREELKKIKRTLQLIYKTDKRYFLLIILSYTLNTIVNYGGIILSAAILNGLEKGQDYHSILRMTIIAIIIMGLLKAVINIIEVRRDIFNEMLGKKITLMKEEKLLSLDFSLLDSPRLKEIQTQIDLDAQWGVGIYSFFWQMDVQVETLINLIGALVVGIPVIHYLNQESTGIVTVSIVILTILIIVGMKLYYYFQSKVLYRLFHILNKEEKKKMYSFTWDFVFGRRGYNYTNGKEIRLYKAYDLMKHWSYDKQHTKAYDDYYITKPQRASFGTGFTLGSLSSAEKIGAYILIGAIAVASKMPVGTVTMFAGCFTNFFDQLLRFCVNYRDLSLTARKQMSTIDFIDLSNEMYQGALPLEKRSDNQYLIEFKNVSFRYPGSEKWSLRNLSLQIKVGERMAIVGRNGSGKTTMIKLLCRLYDPTEGQILINGIDIKKYRQEEYLSLFSVVFQDFKLFSFMLGENVGTSTEYEKEKVMNCLKRAGLEERMEELSLDTYLYKDYSDEGVEVSGGEAQKIALARAMYKNAPFVLLDEPTSALDPIAEAEIYSQFDQIVQNKTAIYISHRLSSCRFCDKIVVFSEGNLVQLGNHEELLRDEEGVYSQLWNAQAKYYESI